MGNILFQVIKSTVLINPVHKVFQVIEPLGLNIKAIEAVANTFDAFDIMVELVQAVDKLPDTRSIGVL